jgi:hypothetical protein
MGDSTAILNMAPPTLKIRSGGQEFQFEFHEYLGPSMVGKRGDPIRGFPPQRSPFWDALHWWIKQGKRVDAEGNCIFEHEMQLVQILEQIGRRSYRVLSAVGTRRERGSPPARRGRKGA